MIKCAFCGKAIEEARYKKVKGKKYHYDCYTSLVEEAQRVDNERKQNFSEESYQRLVKYILALYNVNSLPLNIANQIEDYISNRGYSYEGIENTLTYFHTILNNPVSEQETIGIVPWLYDEAQRFYQKMKEVNDYNVNKKIKDQTVIARIKKPDCKIESSINIEEL